MYANFRKKKTDIYVYNLGWILSGETDVIDRYYFLYFLPAASF